MPRLIWTPQALTDVQRLYRFLAAKDVPAARRAVRTLRAGVAILAHQPHLGRVVGPDAGDLREWLIDFGKSGYVMLYRVEDERLLLLAIRHQTEAGY